MINDDTIKLLRECNAGIKMGVSSLEEVIEHVKNPEMKNILKKCKEEHSTLGNTTHELLIEYHDDDKEPNPIAKGMSWVKTNFKMAVDSSDNSISDIITDGCNMGVKALNKYLNQYKDADERVKDLTKKIISSEERLIEDLKEFL